MRNQRGKVSWRLERSRSSPPAAGFIGGSSATALAPSTCSALRDTDVVMAAAWGLPAPGGRPHLPLICALTNYRCTRSAGGRRLSLVRFRDTAHSHWRRLPTGHALETRPHRARSPPTDRCRHPPVPGAPRVPQRATGTQAAVMASKDAAIGAKAAAGGGAAPVRAIDARRAQLLVKPRKRTPAEAFPSTLHLVRRGGRGASAAFARVQLRAGQGRGAGAACRGALRAYTALAAWCRARCRLDAAASFRCAAAEAPAHSRAPAPDAADRSPLPPRRWRSRPPSSLSATWWLTRLS